jgi:hypothetical protein
MHYESTCLQPGEYTELSVRSTSTQLRTLATTRTSTTFLRLLTTLTNKEWSTGRWRRLWKSSLTARQYHTEFDGRDLAGKMILGRTEQHSIRLNRLYRPMKRYCSAYDYKGTDRLTVPCYLLNCKESYDTRPK